MVDSGDDDSFAREFLARARERQAKLSIINDEDALGSRVTEKTDISYPPLSPLEETDESSDMIHNDQASITENKEENLCPSELNYSSDLSLECNNSDLYRAEPVTCNSSPEVTRQQQHLQSLQSMTHDTLPKKIDAYGRISPRKQPNTVPFQTQQVQVVASQEKKQDPRIIPSQPTTERSNNEFKEKEILIMKERAEQTKLQLKKVVEISKYGSKEHIEAARLLQIAEMEHLNYTNQLVMFKEGMRKQSESLGSIQLSNIRLKISSKLRNDLADDGVSHNFFCVAVCGLEVKATEIIDTNDIRRQDLKAHLQFKEMITFADLPPSFVVKFEVYELVTGQHLPKLLSRLTPSKKTKITPESQFKRIGSLKLTLSDRDTSCKNLTQWSKHEESKYIERECKFTMLLRPEQLPTKAAMLHVRCLDYEGRPDWSRFWVNLSESKIRFWKCKQDSLDGKKPNLIIDFNDLCSESVQKLTPNDDLYRQNSFVIYSVQLMAGGEKDNLFQRVLKEDTKYKIAKHQLAADSKEDRDSWCAVLDRSMHCFREWHGKTRIYTLDEINDIFAL